MSTAKARIKAKHAEAGYNSKLIEFFDAVMPKEPVDKSDVQMLRNRWENYVALCSHYDQKVSNMAAYRAMGISQVNVSQWSNNPADPRFELMNEVKSYCSMYREAMMMDSTINPVVGIFWQKNYDGFKDQTERIEVKVNPLEGLMDTKQLEQRYKPIEIIQEKKPELVEPEIID